MKKILVCTCCGADITAPVMVGGNPYGWSCASKVSGNKRKKTNVLQATVLKFENETESRRDVVLKVGESKFRTVFFGSAENGSGYFTQAGNLFVAEALLR